MTLMSRACTTNQSAHSCRRFCTNTPKRSDDGDLQEVDHKFDEGRVIGLPAAVRIDPQFEAPEPACSWRSVTFEPGARTAGTYIRLVRR